jgi:murein DD-endopeptidase MepM/ murein hydrolase activator NlpD
MINQYSSISPTSRPAGTNIQPTSQPSSTAEIISSFKEILSMMTATSSLSAGQSTGMGVGDLMAPLMLLLLERLVEEQLEREPSATNAEQSSPTASAGSHEHSEDSYVGPKTDPSGRPVVGRLTQNFHGGHRGLDIAVPVGTPIKTTMDGRVVHAGWNNQGYGNLVIVENGDTRTYYAHLSSIPVSVGDTVRAGTTIGLSGNTGNSTGPHLHYEIRKNKVPIDPTGVTLV